MTDWFAAAVAEHYDEDTVDMPVEPVVEFLAPLGDGAGARARRSVPGALRCR